MTVSRSVPPTRPFDPASAADRRRFFIERALRTRSRGAGSDLKSLLAGTLPNVAHLALFDGIPTMLIGAHAAAAYAPPRQTADVDVIFPFDRYAEADARLRTAGWIKTQDLVFPGSRLGLVGAAWSQAGSEEIDVMTSDQHWLRDAFALASVLRSDGARVIPRDYLVLMKVESARGHDQGDLTRILGLMNDAEVELTISRLSRYLDDGNIAEDLRHYAQIGRWEYETGEINVDDGR